ncbi:MAG: CRISPR-associated endonuclease Cas3'' [Lysobacteraceae bacterium]
MQREASWDRYWGKAKALSGTPDHPLVLHSLDVAACGQAYLDRNPALIEQLAVWLGLDTETAKQVITFLLAVHDIGKFAENFQNKAPDVVVLRFGHALEPSNSLMHHDEVGACFFGWMIEQQTLPEKMQGWPADVWQVLLTASFGHHGTAPPPIPTGRNAASSRLGSAMFADSREDAKRFFTWCAERFLPIALPACSEERARLASWWIAGLAVLADWIGSNTTWFPYAEAAQRRMSLEEYWQHHALPRARGAIDEAGVIPVLPTPYMRPESLFSELRNAGLRPAQALAADLPIGSEPQILFLEDATGSGKTEAALILAARLIDAGLADGLFFGLPTQATADQMFDRVSGNLPGWFDDPTRGDEPVNRPSVSGVSGCSPHPRG